MTDQTFDMVHEAALRDAVAALCNVPAEALADRDIHILAAAVNRAVQTYLRKHGRLALAQLQAAGEEVSGHAEPVEHRGEA